MASKLHPLTVPIRGGGRALGLAIAGSVLGSMVQEPLRAMAVAPRWLPVGLLLAVVFGFGAIGYEVLRYRLYAYELTDETLNIDSGVLFRREREIPLGRIQNVDMTRSIVQRALGITAVGIETAGGSSTEASLQFVSVTEGKRLQEGIRTRKRELDTEPQSAVQPGSNDDVEPGPEPDAEVVFELDDESLVLYSLLSFDPRAASVLFIIVPGGMPFISPYVNGLGPTLLVLFGLLVLLFGAIVVWLLSAFARFVGYYGFTLTRIGEELRYERGLLQRYDGSIPEGKIQTVVIEENLLMRRFGYASLSIETAGYAPGAASGSESAVPLAKRTALLELARDVEPFGELAFDRPAPAAKRRYTFRYALALTAVLGLGFAVSRLVMPLPWYGIGVLYAVVPLAARKKWEHRGWGLPTDYIVTRNGFWRRRTHVVPADRVQTVVDRRTLFQRRWQLGTIVVDTASSAGFVSQEAQAIDIHEEDAEELRETVADRLLISLGIRSERSTDEFGEPGV
ncbi:MAG: PH domain-containing protein [Halodesulfurarchaeum sp.]